MEKSIVIKAVTPGDWYFETTYIDNGKEYTKKIKKSIEGSGLLAPNKTVLINLEQQKSEKDQKMYWNIISIKDAPIPNAAKPQESTQQAHVDTSKPTNGNTVDYTRRSIERQKALDITAQHLRFEGDTIETIFERAEKVYQWISK